MKEESNRLDSVETGDKDVFFQIGFFILNYIMLGSDMLHYQPFYGKGRCIISTKCF